MLKASGTIKVERNKSRIVVDTDRDIVDYYDWFIRKEYKIILQKPLHGAHVTIASPKIHKGVNWNRAEYYDGEKVQFEYDPYLIRGGYTKGFIMFYLKVYSPALDNMKKDLNIVDNVGYRGLHITVNNGKFNNVRPYWMEMIQVRQ